jgi:DNA polymerase-4
VKTILHVDMDAFYASVEQLDAPGLRGQPVIVGGPSRRGVVLAASYEVRPFGVRSAMPMAEALRRAPHAIVVAPRRARYEQLSVEAFAIFRRYTPLVEPLSLDEAFLDVTASRALFGDGATIARAIKDAIRGELGLTASAGVAPGKFAAKVASDLEKPDGLVIVPTSGVASFLAPLSIERMWGVGPKTAPALRALGIATLGDLARADPRRIEPALGAWGMRAVALARGEDDRDVNPSRGAVTMGAEQTVEIDLRGFDEVAAALLEHARRVARRLVEAGASARTVAIKIKYTDFSVRTRRETLREPVQDTDSLHRAALRLLARVPLQGRAVRLTGLGVSGITDGAPPRLLIADPQAEKLRRVEHVAAEIAHKFGDGAGVTRGTLVDPPKGGESRRAPGGHRGQ